MTGKRFVQRACKCFDIMSPSHTHSSPNCSLMDAARPDAGLEQRKKAIETVRVFFKEMVPKIQSAYNTQCPPNEMIQYAQLPSSLGEALRDQVWWLTGKLDDADE